MDLSHIGYRQLGRSGLMVSSVAMGCWPISGMTSLDVNDVDSRATLEAAANAGINFFDSAYCYGRKGESEELIHQALGDRRDELVIATKGGAAWSPDGSLLVDASPSMLRLQCDKSLERLKTDRIDLYYLHRPDPNTPIEESASALAELIKAGKIRYAGASQCSVAQLEAFHAICPLTAIQPRYNLLQREIELDILPWAERNGIGTVVYNPLMKGLLAGRLLRQFVFLPGDGRANYPMFQGEEWERNQSFLDTIRELAEELNRSVAEIVINWTIHQSNICSALCGAKRPYQILDSAQAMSFRLSKESSQIIEQALMKRGYPIE